MNFKGLGKRAYNVIFHTHTVAGIVISFLLYIIFFAGAFTLFKDEAYRWENPTARYEAPADFDINKAIDKVFAQNPNIKTYELITIKIPTKDNPEFNLYGNEVKPDSTEVRSGLIVNSQTYEVMDEENMKSQVVETLYHLHYLRHIPLGLYISGLVALFFFFASVTGVLIHWKNIIKKFYLFRTRKGLKNLWKDAHTTLAMIGIPFQIIYGITGSFLGLSILILAPSVVFLFDGDQSQIRGVLDPFFEIKAEPDAPRNENIPLAELLIKTQEKYPNHETKYARIKNYGTDAEAVSFMFDDYKSISGNGAIVFETQTGTILNETIPDEHDVTGAFTLVTKLHYATFGGLVMKFVYFLLAMITCFMIISGVLLWQSARDNKKYTDKQRLFHHRVTKTYLNICFSLFPATAIIFIANMFVSFDMPNRIEFVNQIFFTSWGVLFVLGYLFKDYKTITKFYFIAGGILSLVVPISNGIVTGDWIWNALSKGYHMVAGVDIFWLIVGVFVLAVINIPIPAKKIERV